MASRPPSDTWRRVRACLTWEIQAMAVLLALLAFTSSYVSLPSSNSALSLDFTRRQEPGPVAAAAAAVVEEAPRQDACPEQERLFQAEKFGSHGGEAEAALGCGRLYGLDAFLAVLWGEESGLVLVDVGANKGYGIVSWVDTWNLVRHKNVESWGKFLEETFQEGVAQNLDLCGKCGHCRQETHENDPDRRSFESKKPNVRLYAIEASFANFKLLKEMEKWLKYEKLSVIHGAVSNHSGIDDFPITPLGFEEGRFGEVTDGHTRVRVMTVDEFMEENEIARINFLRVDAEGHDPYILKGAAKAFQEHRIDIVDFGYHFLDKWQVITLEEVVKEFDSMGYDCFLQLWNDPATKHALVSLTGCWFPAFEFRNRAHVLCATRRSAPLAAFLRRACPWRT